MTEIMPVPRNLSFTVLPAGGFRALFYIPAVWREGKGAFAQPFFFLETTTTTAMTTTTAAAMPMMRAVLLVLAAGSTG